MARQPTKYTSLISLLPASLQTISRRVILALLAVFTAVVLLLVQSALWSSAVSVWMRLTIVALALVAYFRPHIGLLVVAAIAPLGQVLSRTLDSQMRGAEALVLAFLAGVLVRGWTLRELRAFPQTRLDVAAVIFALVVAASCVEQIWFLQIQRDFAAPFLSSVLDYSIRNYLSSFRGLGMIFNAMLLIEGLALLAYAAHVCRVRNEFARQLAIWVVIGGITATSVNFWHFARYASDTADSLNGLPQLMQGQRWTAYVGDVNAAGSFFAMTMFLAIGAGLINKTRRVTWLLAGLALGVALWMTASRTAIAAVVIAGTVVTSIVMVRRFRDRPMVIVAAFALVLTLGLAVWRFFPAQFTGNNASMAVTVRWLFLQTTWRMLQEEPLFGVGIGQYAQQSQHHAPKEMIAYYARENAHNNFAQVSGELGLLGLVSFVSVLLVSTMRGRQPTRALHPLVAPFVSAIGVFVLTWLGGHPLLVPETSYPFWLVLGVGSALLTTESRQPPPYALIAVGALLLLASMSLRVNHKVADLDMTQIRYGISEKGMMGARGRLFVPADKAHIDLPLRSRIATPQSPIEVDVVINDRIVDTITMVDDRWFTRRIELPGGARHFQHIDLELRQDVADREDGAARRSSVEIGDWNIIAKPHG